MIKTFVRQFKSQLANSKNLKETIDKRIKRSFWANLYLCKGIIIAVRNVNKECIGSKIIYNGNVYRISNWARSEAPTISGKGFYKQRVLRSEIKNILDISEIFHRLDSNFTFYMDYWHGIDVNKKIYKSDYKG